MLRFSARLATGLADTVEHQHVASLREMTEHLGRKAIGDDKSPGPLEIGRDRKLRVTLVQFDIGEIDGGFLQWQGLGSIRI